MTNTIILPAIKDALVNLLVRGRERAESCNHPVLVSLAQPFAGKVSPLTAFATGSRRDSYRMLWGQPEQGFWLVGKDNAVRLNTGGGVAMTDISEAYQSLLQSAVVEGADICGVGPVSMGGLRYDAQARRDVLWEDFPDALFMIPRFLFTWAAGARWLTINTIVEPKTDPCMLAESVIAELEDMNRTQPVHHHVYSVQNASEGSRNEWGQWVQKALLAIESGELSKVVLARRKVLHANGQFCLENALENLSSNYPGCTVFAIDNGKASFFGATPESLSRVQEGRLSVTCLAGSIARGDSPEEDFRLQNELLESRKERFEHAAVVAMVTTALKDLCCELDWDAVPQVMKLKKIQHLMTPVTGKLNPDSSILDVVRQLHPTPAVAGVPTDRALEFIRETEGDRGWYAAPVGWFDHTGSGEFAVAIRSALLNRDRAALFAGCGIVQGSDADREFRETEIKFQTIFEALSGS